MTLKNLSNLFLKNIGVKQTILKNTFWLIVAELFTRFLDAILIVYIVRTLGAAEFGKFAFAMAFASIFIAFSGLGLSDIFTRELSKDKTVEKEYPAILSFKIILGVITFILVIVTSFFITSDPLIRLIIGALTIYYFFNDFFLIIYAFLRAHQKMEYEAGFKILRSLLLIIIVFPIIFKNPSIQNISCGYLFSNFLSLILLLSFFHFKISPLRLNFDKKVWHKFLKISWSLGLATILGAVLLNMDSVIIGYLNQNIQNGWYNAARKTIAIIMIPSSLIFVSFYPILSKLFKESKDNFQQLWNLYMKLMIVLALPIMVGGFSLAPQIIKFIFGLNFSPSITVFQILIFIVGISFLCNPYTLILIVSGHQRKYLWVNLMGFAVNLILNLILIPRYSLYGAAISAVITYVVLFLSSVEFSRRFTHIFIFNADLLKTFFVSVIASMAMFFTINQMSAHSINILVNILTGTLIYFIVLFLIYKLPNLSTKGSAKQSS